MDHQNEIIEEIIEKGIDHSDRKEIDMEFLQDFIVEVKEHLEHIESEVLEFENNSDNAEIIHSLFRHYHTIKGLAGFVEQEMVQKIAHETETLLDSCRKGKIQITKKIANFILKSSDYIKQICNDFHLNKQREFIHIVEEHLEALQGSGFKKYDKNASCNCDTEEEGNLKTYKNEIQDAAEKDRGSKNRGSSVADLEYIRIPAYKVDNLVDLMGELMMIHSQVEQQVDTYSTKDDMITNHLARMSKLIKEVQNLSMSLRMVSLRSTFLKINRIARDTIEKLNKNVIVFIHGEETEIDRGVVDKIFDPLLHVVKNSISHGIEGEEERRQKGKNPQGQVKIHAYSNRGMVYIEISDDGRGISKEKVYQKAVEKKLVDPSKNYTDEEIMEMIFFPGFSTADTVSNIAGRGVGLDVVKTEITKIGGKVEVRSSEGEGCIFTLKIPINLAAMNGTIVNILGEGFIIPTLHIKQILQPHEQQWVLIKGKKKMIKVRQEIIPIIPIAEVLGQEEEDQQYDTGLMIILELEQKLKALPVRGIVERREIVVKPLGVEFGNLHFISGASILGDGKVSLILDIESLFKMEVEK